MLLRPLPTRNSYFAYGVAVAYIRASGEEIDDSFELWRDLITDIRALRLTVYNIADRLRSWLIERFSAPPRRAASPVPNNQPRTRHCEESMEAQWA